ncbi:MAG: hypothetical protein BWY91_01614 [bacterium ADurb.BinA028]|nr:MAG: hypothetical protein BWY91_01614 [bacterium ADurb.BinA028]
MPTPVERRGRILDQLVGGGGAGGEEAGAHPRHELLASGVVSGDDDDPTGPPGADPVLGDRDGLGGAGAGSVDLRVGAAGADDLGELRVPHRQHPKEEPAVEVERVLVDLALELGDERVDLGADRLAAGQHGPHAFKGQQVLAASAVLRVVADLLDEVVIAGERRGKDDPGVVAHRVRQAPAVGQLRADGRLLVVHHQRDARIPQRVETGPEGHPRGRVKCGVAARVDPVLLDDVQRRALTGKLDDVGLVVDDLEAARPGGGVLDQSGDPHPGHLGADGCRELADELLAAEDPGDVGVVEHGVDTGQSKPGAADDDRLLSGRSRRTLRCGRGCHGVCRVAGTGGASSAAREAIELHALFEDTGEELAQLGDDRLRGGSGSTRSGAGGRRNGGGHDRRGG